MYMTKEELFGLHIAALSVIISENPSSVMLFTNLCRREDEPMDDSHQRYSTVAKLTMFLAMEEATEELCRTAVHQMFNPLWVTMELY